MTRIAGRRLRVKRPAQKSGRDETMGAGRRDEMMARVEVGAARRRRLPLLVRIAAGLVISLLIVAVIGYAAAWRG